MLTLASTTDSDWLDDALAHLEEIMLDHVHCEKKAAGAAIKLLFSYPQHVFLQEPLSRLAREELGHFEEALRHLESRGVRFGRQRPSPYGGKLHAHVRRAEPERLVDLLLVCALIEARSCERLKLLAGAVEDSDLGGFYKALLAAEARHHQIYVDLARQVTKPDEVDARLEELARVEAGVIAEPRSLIRLHT